mmetsp:Transcript_61132/g.157653  ORF Transcript_61132/g.157653 Transcript_61132/m.157653 type:complete len:400 (-) Transcript_61132:1723-2922(-)
MCRARACPAEGSKSSSSSAAGRRDAHGRLRVALVALGVLRVDADQEVARLVAEALAQQVHREGRLDAIALGGPMPCHATVRGHRRVVAVHPRGEEDLEGGSLVAHDVDEARVVGDRAIVQDPPVPPHVAHFADGLRPIREVIGRHGGVDTDLLDAVKVLASLELAVATVSPARAPRVPDDPVVGVDKGAPAGRDQRMRADHRLAAGVYRVLVVVPVRELQRLLHGDEDWPEFVDVPLHVQHRVRDRKALRNRLDLEPGVGHIDATTWRRLSVVAGQSVGLRIVLLVNALARLLPHLVGREERAVPLLDQAGLVSVQIALQVVRHALLFLEPERAAQLAHPVVPDLRRAASVAAADLVTGVLRALRHVCGARHVGVVGAVPRVQARIAQDRLRVARDLAV